MPSIDDPKPSWADEIDMDPNALPASTEVVEKDQKIVTEYKFNDDDKKVKVVRTYKIVKQEVPRSVARRKTWTKFGDSTNDKPGPNPHTTMVSEEITMQFITNKEEEKVTDPLLESLKNNIAKCRICQGEHWSVNCPYKGTSMEKFNEKLIETKPSSSMPESSSSKTGGKYVPPFMKDQKGGMPNMRGRDDTAAIRISNLSELMVEADLEELVKRFGAHNKMYLARDKNTGLCKGFAYVHFKNRTDAARAIDALNGHGYDHLILNVEWSKPQNN